MKVDRTKLPVRLIRITAERLSDNSRITFTISSNKKIKYLRSLLNHHLPPYTSNQFNLYSYQRGALIHFHPQEFKLDYFPVIFDQNILLLKMDDRNLSQTNEIPSFSDRKKSKSSLTFIQRLFSSITKANKDTSDSSVTCSSAYKHIFRKHFLVR